MEQNEWRLIQCKKEKRQTSTSKSDATYHEIEERAWKLLNDENDRRWRLADQWYSSLL